MKNILKRTTLIVRDAERAADWYSQVFGMNRWLDTPFTLSGRGLAIGAEGDSTRLVIMSCEDPVIGMIGLLEWLDPKMEIPAPGNTLSPGMPIFVMSSDDALGVCERARGLGSLIHTEPYEWSYEAPDGGVKNFLGCSFFDLDGHFFEVNQLL